MYYNIYTVEHRNPVLLSSTVRISCLDRHMLEEYDVTRYIETDDRIIFIDDTGRHIYEVRPVNKQN